MSAAFCCLGLAYFFVWGSVGQHTQSLWISPQDLWITYFASSQLAHGHFGDIYQSKVSFVEFPGILIALAPLGALSNAFHTTVLEVTRNGVLPAQGLSLRAANIPFLNAQEFHFGNTTYVSHPQWVTWVDPYALILSCTALFACDALAERLQVPRSQRVVLCLAEAVLLWNVTVWWGHPEDAVAVALAIYALVFILEGRFAGGGWLFGAAVVFQPLVLLMLPILLAKAGRRHGIGFAFRTVVPAGVLLAVPLIASPTNTLRALLDQPSSPNVNHATPWTAVSPSLGGHGPQLDSCRRTRPGLSHPARHRSGCLGIPTMAGAARANCLGLCPGLGPTLLHGIGDDRLLRVGRFGCRLGGGGAKSRFRFHLAIALAIATTVLAQWKLGWFPCGLSKSWASPVCSSLRHSRNLWCLPSRARRPAAPDPPSQWEDAPDPVRQRTVELAVKAPPLRRKAAPARPRKRARSERARLGSPRLHPAPQIGPSRRQRGDRQLDRTKLVPHGVRNELDDQRALPSSLWRRGRVALERWPRHGFARCFGQVVRFSARLSLTDHTVHIRLSFGAGHRPRSARPGSDSRDVDDGGGQHR